MTKINMAELRRGMRFMTSRNTLIAKKYAPAVMTGVGVVGVVLGSLKHIAHARPAVGKGCTLEPFQLSPRPARTG